VTPRQAASSLVTRFIVVGLSLMIIGSIASYYRITGFLREDLLQSAAASQLAMAGQVARTLDARIDERRLLLERLAASLPPPLPGDRERLRTWLAGQHALQLPFSPGLLVADLQGRIIARSPSSATFPPGPDIGSDAGFQAALEGRTSLGRPQRDPATKQAVLPIATPVWDGSGQRIAVLVGITDLALLAPLGPGGMAADAAAGYAPDIRVVSVRDALVVAASDPRRVLEAAPQAGQQALHDRAAAGAGGTARTVDAEGIEHLSAHAAIGSTGWYASVQVPASQALATVERTQDFLVRLTLTRLLLVLLVVGLLVAWLLRPLYRAAKLADRMTHGELPLQPLPVAHPDEVGHLTAAFNRLLGKLSDKQSELEAMAFHDALTGLPNRKLLVDRMVQALARAKRNGTRVALLFLDLDGFKVINDTRGHEAGDEALRQVAGRLSALVRKADTLARLGGDEFVLLAPDLPDPVDLRVRTLGDKCVAAVACPIEWTDGTHTLEVSIGIAVSGPGDDPDSLLAAADKAMYAAKRGGSGGYVLADGAQAAPPG
jgi:diguanylate cyclase (GGDEF)-like protein